MSGSAPCWNAPGDQKLIDDAVANMKCLHAEDANGNLLSDGQGHSFNWNERNQLAAEVNLETFSYDALGRWHTRENWVAQWSLSYLFDGLNAVQIQYSNGPPANLLTGLGLDQRFQWSDSSGTVDFMTDAIGSTWGLANASGDAQTNFQYGPFGYTTGSGTVTDSDIDFAGRELDMNNILYYMRNRFYSPVLSRFISPDPAGVAGGDTNLYAYAHDDPTNLTDPMGLFSGGAGGGGGGGGPGLGPPPRSPRNGNPSDYMGQGGVNGEGGSGPTYCNTCGVIAYQAGGVGNLNVGGGLLQLGGGNLLLAQALRGRPQPTPAAPGPLPPAPGEPPPSPAHRICVAALAAAGFGLGIDAADALASTGPVGILLAMPAAGSIALSSLVVADAYLCP
jgi:RHS repeat-associated protein